VQVAQQVRVQLAFGGGRRIGAEGLVELSRLFNF
jgi:hypothetical protein